jgi:adenylate cyclase
MDGLQFMADVFVSYARSDKALVAPLVAAIEAQGWTVWWDPEIDAGQQFDDRIEAELKKARAVLVVWTPTSASSRWVRGEAREAADRGTLVPVRFEAASLPMDVRAIHTTDLDGWGGNAQGPQFQALLRSLGAMIVRQGGSQASSAGAGLASSAAAPATPRLAICVLPFANMSGDSEQEYFSDGISEDIITDLSKVSSLAVASRNSAFMYKGLKVDVPKVARELKVSHVLEGSVRKAGGRVRITAQLVDASSNDSIWAERFDRDLNDIFSLQDEISQAIVKALKLKLLPEEKKAIERRGTENVEAYNIYLMARQNYATGIEQDPKRAEASVRMCRRATEIDPDYARAWALMALGQMLLHFAHGRRGDDGMAAAERALALDGNLAEAHAVKARILSQYGRHEQASAEIDIALRLDPESYEVNKSAAYLAVRQHQLDEAIRYYEKAMALMDTDVNSPSMLVTCYAAIGDRAGVTRAAQVALARAEKILTQDQNNGAVMGYGVVALAALGQVERTREWINRALLIDPDNMNMRYNFGCALTTLGEIEAAIDILRRAFETAHIDRLNHAKVDPDLDPLREDARFKAMMAEAEARIAAAGDNGSAPPI